MKFTSIFGKKAQVSTSSTPSLDAQLLDILNKLTKDDESKNILLIEEIVKTIVADAKNPASDLQITIKKTKVGLEELLKNNSNPDAELIDKLFSLIVVSKSKEAAQAKQAEEDAKNTSVQVESEQPKMVPKDTPARQPVAPAESTAEAQPQSAQPDDVLHSDSGQAMLGLMMDEIKELVVVSSKVNKRVEDLESKQGAVVDGIQNEQKSMKQEVEDMKSKVEKMEKSIEKFIGLYEVISNMYNPFMKEESRSKESVVSNGERGSEKEPAKADEQSSENFFDAQFEKQKELTKQIKKD